MWNALSDAEKVTFERQYRHLFPLHNNPMPPESAYAMVSYLESGWCALKSGLSSISSAASGFELHYEQTGESIAVDNSW